MALGISPGILAAIVILSVELIVIIVVVVFLICHSRKMRNQTQIPDEKKGKLGPEPIIIKNTRLDTTERDDDLIIENEEANSEISKSRKSSESSIGTEEKKSLDSTTTEESSSSSEEEQDHKMMSEEAVEEEKEDHVEEQVIAVEEPESEKPIEEPIVETITECEDLEPVTRSITPSISSSSSSDSDTEQEVEEIEKEEIQSVQETQPQEIEEIEPVQPTLPKTKSIDASGITLSLRIGGKGQQKIHVNGQPISINVGTQSSSDESEESYPSMTQQREMSMTSQNDIEVVRRYDQDMALESQASSTLIYDPIRKQMMNRPGSAASSFSSNSETGSDVQAGTDEAVAGIINVTKGEKLTICQAVQHGLIPKRTALLLLEAQAATGSVVNPKNGVKLSVCEAVQQGIVDSSYQKTLIAAEGAYYGFLDPRTNENVSLNTAMNRGIFPKQQGVRLLEAQVATGGIIDPWTGMRYTVGSAISKGLIDRETAKLVKNNEEQEDFFDPGTKRKLGYGDILSKCIRDLDTGLKFLYIEEKPKTNETRYQPELLTFRSAFRRKVTLQELIDAGLVNQNTLDAFQSGKISKEELRDILHPYLVGEEPICGILNKTTYKVLTICQAVKEGILRRGTALELLEAQAATGSIIDPMSGKKMSVSRAVSLGLVDSQYAVALRRAEQAVNGYKEPGTNRNISLFEAIKRGVVIENHGIRMLEAQLATGGLIDTRAGYRIPMSVAVSRGLFDNRMAEVLTKSNSDAKGYYYPTTGENLTYGELMQKCVRNKRKNSNMLLLPLHDNAPMAGAMQRGPVRHRKIIIMDPSTKKQISVEQALEKKVIDENTAQKLTAQQSSWNGSKRP